MTPKEKLDSIAKFLYLGTTDFLQWSNDQQLMNYAKNLTKDSQWLIARVKELEGALEYIVDHEWAKDKPKWANEFIVVSRKALKGES